MAPSEQRTVPTQMTRPAWTNNTQNLFTNADFPNLRNDTNPHITETNTETQSSITEIINLLSDNDLLQKITCIIKKLTESLQIVNTIVFILKRFQHKKQKMKTKTVDSFSSFT